MTASVRLLLCVGFLLTACAPLQPRVALPDQPALAPATTGRLAERVTLAEAAHPGQSGFRLISSGPEAYAIRARSAQAATSSLDVQTYIWHDDLTGRLLASHLLDSADRGVRVRLLVDDFDARAKSRALAALDAHPQIEVRLFNPFSSRRGKLKQYGELATNLKRLNYRMHNKSWIVDNHIALIGGRNLGDEYFGASQGSNFVDLDFAMAGPVVREVSGNFDRFWNSRAAYPVAQLSPELVSDEALASLRRARAGVLAEEAASPYAQTLEHDEAVQRVLAGEGDLRWSREWHFVSDDPLKALIAIDEGRSAVLAYLAPAMRASRQSLTLISPYFVPGRQGTQSLVGKAQAGVPVRVLTNSLAANDVAAVHAGYSRYRTELLDGGVELWELKPGGQAPSRFSLKGSSGSALHTKAVLIDADQVYVGSYNLDPRSTALNCEQLVMVRDPELAAEMRRLFAEQTSGAQAWHVQRSDGRLRWSDGTTTWRRDPEASFSRRAQVLLMRVLPVESQL